MAVGTIVRWICVICFLFLVIPIRIHKRQNDVESLFKEFVLLYNKPYINNATEYEKRFLFFQKSLNVIEELNRNRSTHSAIYGVTRFCDLTKDEFQLSYLRQRKNDEVPDSHRTKRSTTLPFPEKWDWRNYGVITSIRNQLTCGACWAFSVVETVETMNAMKNRSLEPLSVQQVIDCAKNGNNGCDGGDSRLLLEWLTTSKMKIEQERLYPYKHGAFQCHYNGSKSGVGVESFKCTSYIGDEKEIQQLIASHGPVTVAVNAINWQYYLGGVIQHHCSSAPADLNHAVQLVGYVNSASIPYYIARNSWGSEFGLDGYLFLSVGDNICGLAYEVCSLDVS